MASVLWQELREHFCRQISNKAGLKKLSVCRHSIQGLQVGSVGQDFFFFFFLWLVLLLFWLLIISRAYVSMQQAVIIDYSFTFYILRTSDCCK